MTILVCVLRSQYDIIDFRAGRRPENILLRDFASAAELSAYEDGIYAINDAYDRIENLEIRDGKVSYTRHSEDPELDPTQTREEAEFATMAEAKAYGLGLGDAEGFAAPLLIDDTDERFEQLVAWSKSDCIV